MPPLKWQRYSGVEDEFRITFPTGNAASADWLLGTSHRFFFEEDFHVPIFPPPTESTRQAGRIWTWYGGTFYNDYDSEGTLVEGTTPLTSVERGVAALVENVVCQRAQLLELNQSANDILGVSTHVNYQLDSSFDGLNLCDFKTTVPSSSFSAIEAQKLGADICLVATHTISPVIAYLLFNYRPEKGALYRPRRNGRLELCLPYIPEPHQMRAGFLFWFSAVDYITEWIKSDLANHDDWQEVYSDPLYYRSILRALPITIQGIEFRKPSYYLGYEIGSGQEDDVREYGSDAVVDTNRGKISVVDLAREYTGLFRDQISQRGCDKDADLLNDFLNWRREVNVDIKRIPRFFRLSASYIRTEMGLSATDFLNKHTVDDLAEIHLRFIKEPFQVIKPYSPASGDRIVRNLAKEVDWDAIRLEIITERSDTVSRSLLVVPLNEVNDYLAIESGRGDFQQEIRRWVQSTETIPNPRNLFAYGTLMNPENNRKKFGILIRNVKPASAYGQAYDFGDFPVLLENVGTSLVPGVVVTPEDFERTVNVFDVYEGCNDPNPVFFRAVRKVALEDFREMDTWMYIGNKNNPSVRQKLRSAKLLRGLWTKATMR